MSESLDHIEDIRKIVSKLGHPSIDTNEKKGAVILSAVDIFRSLNKNEQTDIFIYLLGKVYDGGSTG